MEQDKEVKKLPLMEDHPPVDELGENLKATACTFPGPEERNLPLCDSQQFNHDMPVPQATRTQHDQFRVIPLLFSSSSTDYIHALFKYLDKL